MGPNSFLNYLLFTPKNYKLKKKKKTTTENQTELDWGDPLLCELGVTQASRSAFNVILTEYSGDVCGRSQTNSESNSDIQTKACVVVFADVRLASQTLLERIHMHNAVDVYVYSACILYIRVDRFLDAIEARSCFMERLSSNSSFQSIPMIELEAAIRFWCMSYIP